MGAAGAHVAADGRLHYITGAEAALRLYTLDGHRHFSAADLDPERLAPLTAEAQEYIWRHQHPANCSAVYFMLSFGHVKGNGIGSILHVTGLHLAAAIERGWIFIWNKETGSEWTDPTTCGDVKNWECHFRAPTNCTLADVHPGNYEGAEMHHGAGGYPGNWVPTVFVKKLKALYPDMRDDEIKYWWRGQSVAYLMRFNDATVRTVREMRYNSTKHIVHAPHEPWNSSLRQVPFPRGVIHAHVRHGDKYTEMTLQPTERYFNASEALVRNQPQAIRRAMFVSTEDTRVLEDAKTYADKWSVVFTDIPRSNAGPLAQVEHLGVHRAGITARTHLLQLLMSMEADAWITTRGSNWNRVLDELRCIWIDKCKHPVVEVGTPESWEGYNW